MVTKKKISAFAKDETEVKMPCRLNLQVWDSDHFSADDFLGEIQFRLEKSDRKRKEKEMKLYSLEIIIRILLYQK